MKPTKQEFEGAIVFVKPTKSGISNAGKAWANRTFVLKTSSTYTNYNHEECVFEEYYPLTVSNETILQLLNTLKEGDMVKGECIFNGSSKLFYDKNNEPSAMVNCRVLSMSVVNSQPAYRPEPHVHPYQPQPQEYPQQPQPYQQLQHPVAQAHPQAYPQQPQPQVQQPHGYQQQPVQQPYASQPYQIQQPYQPQPQAYQPAPQATVILDSDGKPLPF